MADTDCKCGPEWEWIQISFHTFHGIPEKIKRINYFSLFQKHGFVFKVDFGMGFHFQNVFLNMLSFPKCERFRECCKQRAVHSL